MKFINGDQPISLRSETQTIFFDKKGDVIAGDAQYKLSHFAKKLTTKESVTFYVRAHQSTLFDPNGPYGRRERMLDTKMEQVSKNTFDFYITYLKTNNSIYLTKAQRGFLND
jgi:hypothetical protein